MMLAPRVTIETLLDPGCYSPAQIRLAYRVASALDRGKLVLTIPPDR